MDWRLTGQHLPIKAIDMANQSLFERISPLWIGIGISGPLIVILLATETALGRWDGLLAEGEFNALARVSGGVLRDVRLAVVHCLLIGYLPAAFLHVMRNGRRTVLALRGALEPSSASRWWEPWSASFSRTTTLSTSASIAC